MSNYPDNIPSPRKGTALFTCTNPDCENRAGWEVRGVYDLGTFSADHDEDTYCPECGAEGE